MTQPVLAALSTFTVTHSVARNTIVANSKTSAACFLFVPLNGASANNLSDDPSCGASFTVSNKLLLGSLGDYGGDTPTVPLLPGSSALGAGATCEATDQRGVTRPQGTACDVGAFESQGFLLAVRSGNNQTTAVNTAFPIPLGVTVTSSFNEPVDGGLVVFTVPDGTIGPSASLAPSTTIAVASGIASVSATANALFGPYSVTANTVGAAAPATFSLANGSQGTATTLAVTPGSANYGQQLTLTAVVTLSSPGSGMPTGSVTFKDGGTAMGPAVTLDASGQATFVTSNLGAGLHNFTADYAGTIAFGASTSNLVAYTINKAATGAVVLTIPPQTVFGQPTTFEATVTALAAGTLLPSGSVAFFDGATNLGSGVLSAAGKATLTTGRLGSVPTRTSPPNTAVTATTRPVPRLPTRTP